MKVALSFYGQPRYVDNPTSFNSHKELILSQDNIEFDVFCHYWFDKNSEYNNISNERFTHKDGCYVVKNANEIIENNYSPIRKLEEKPRTYLFKEYDVMKSQISLQKYYSDEEFYHMLSQLYSFEKSMNLVSEYSKETNTTYDFVISSRFDNNIIKFPKLNILRKGYIYSSGRYGPKSFVDAIMIIDSNFIDYNPYSNFIKCSQMSPYFATDEYKKSAFALKYGYDCITNHSELDIGLIRGKFDTYGQL